MKKMASRDDRRRVIRESSERVQTGSVWVRRAAEGTPPTPKQESTAPREADDRKQVDAVPLRVCPPCLMSMKPCPHVSSEAKVAYVPASELARVEALYEQAQEEGGKMAVIAAKAVRDAFTVATDRATTAEAERDAALAKLKNVEEVAKYCRRETGRSTRTASGRLSPAYVDAADRLDRALSNQEET